MTVFTADPTDSEIVAVASPTNPSDLQSVSAFARFEFEPGKGNEGTKILMVEWENEDVSRNTAGAWQVSWPGKSTQLHADERPADNLRRIYLLLGPGQTIPPTIMLSYEPPPDSAATAKKPQRLVINPLPAIFPPELGATARQSGRKGVLHTIWAKKRLQVLDREIQHERDFNLEGIALEMATVEKEWIESNFGISSNRPSLGSLRSPSSTLGPGSPRSPGGGRLSEKLRGLSLGTSERDLSRRMDGRSSTTLSLHSADKQAVNTPSHESHPLSPETQDVAVSFFGSFRNTPISASSSLSQVPMSAGAAVKDEAQTSLDAPVPFASLTRQKSTDSGEELFAKALSPRTPDLRKSPFSFSTSEIMPYLQNR